MELVDITSFADQLDRESHIPVYSQIHSWLKGKIIGGELAADAALPSQEAFSRLLGVNHITLRQALSLLKDQGYIRRKRGSGTFVQPASEWQQDDGTKRLAFLFQGRQRATLQESYLAKTYAEMTALATAQGYETLSLAIEDPHLHSRLAAQNVDAVVAMPMDRPHSLEQLARISVPRVILEIETRLPGLDNILIDCHQGVYDGVCELIRLGHKHLAFVSALIGSSHDNSLRTPQDAFYRFRAFRQALEDGGLGWDAAGLLEIPFEQDDADALVRDLFTRPELPTALVVFDDALAQHVLRALSAYDIRVPQDVSILAFGDMPRTDQEPALATVTIAWEEMASLAVQRLTERIRSGGMGGLRASVPTCFKPGPSMAAPPKRRRRLSLTA